MNPTHHPTRTQQQKIHATPTPHHIRARILRITNYANLITCEHCKKLAKQ